MYMKICPYCQGASYSASEYGEWLCPYCKHDITDINAVNPGNRNVNKLEEE